MLLQRRQSLERLTLRLPILARYYYGKKYILLKRPYTTLACLARYSYGKKTKTNTTKK
jgi:hypothetical protein